MPETRLKGAFRGPSSGPFGLDNPAEYRRWRVEKLRHSPETLSDQTIRLDCPGALRPMERRALTLACRRANFALYHTDPARPPTLAELRDFGNQLGLVHFDHHLWAPEDGIVAIRRHEKGGRASYIPYSDRPMNWHTDGYYNPPDAAVRGVIMHCVAPAAEGGANRLVDPELVYIALRDADPAYIEALMQPDVMTIPENDLEPGQRRPAVSGAVFSVSASDGALHMRYTARKRSIHWKEDAATRDAVAFLEELLTPPVPFEFRVRLTAGQGIVCNNVLHTREGFTDGPAAEPQRLLWRARYRERIAGTAPWGDAVLESGDCHR